MLLIVVLSVSCLSGVTSQHDFLLVARRQTASNYLDHGVYRVWVHNDTWQKLPITTSGSPYDVTYDPVTELVIWSDGSGQYGMHAAYMNGTGQRVVIADEQVYGLSIDSRQGAVYFTRCCSSSSIEAYFLDSGNRSVLVNWGFTNHQPRAITLEMRSNKLFVADYKSNVIWQLNIDGTGLKTIIRGITSPTSLAISSSGNSLYVCTYYGEHYEIGTQTASIRSNKSLTHFRCDGLESNNTHLFMSETFRHSSILVTSLAKFDPSNATQLPGEPSGGYPSGLHYARYNPAPATRSPINPPTTTTTSATTAAASPAPPAPPVVVSSTTTRIGPNSARTTHGPTASSNDSQTADGGGISQGLLMGIAAVIAACAALAIGIGIGVYCCRKQQAKNRQRNNPNPFIRIENPGYRGRFPDPPPFVPETHPPTSPKPDSETIYEQIVDDVSYEELRNAYPTSQPASPTKVDDFLLTANPGDDYLTPSSVGRSSKTSIDTTQTESSVSSVSYLVMVGEGDPSVQLPTLREKTIKPSEYRRRRHR